MIILLLISAVLLSSSLTGAQEEHVRNFEVVSQTNTHVTFSWEIVDGYCTSSDINYFNLYFEYKSLYTSSLHIQYSETTQYGAKFMYTTSFEAIYNTQNGIYYSAEVVTWIRVYRSSQNPRSVYSERLYVNFGQLETVFEFKVHLWPSQTCSDVIEMSAFNYYYYSHTSVLEHAIKEIRWLLLQSCQCALPYYFGGSVGYFTCATRDYLILRVQFTSSYSSVDLNTLKANLTSFIAGNKGNVLITLSGGGYFISPGPCGLTVPDLNSPHCFNDSLDEEASTQPIFSSYRDNTTPTPTTSAAPTTMSAAPTTMPAAPTTMPAAPTTMPAAPTTMPAAPTTIPAAPTTMPADPNTASAVPTNMLAAPTTTANPTTIGNAQPVVMIAQDNTAVIAIVAAMCTATMLLVLSAGILFLILFMRMKKMASKETPLSQLHWHNGTMRDTPWVLSDDHQDYRNTSQQDLVIPESADDDKV